MIRIYVAPALVLTVALTAIPVLHADVKTDEKSLVTFGGTLGRIVTFFGGKGAKDGVMSTIAVAGDRKMMANDTRGGIIDLKEEKIYDLDMRRKTYTVMTFEQMRQHIAEAARKSRERQQGHTDSQTANPVSPYMRCSADSGPSNGAIKSSTGS